MNQDSHEQDILGGPGQAPYYNPKMPCILITYLMCVPPLAEKKRQMQHFAIKI